MRIPKHIGIIPDGNRRWAKQAGLPKQDGYVYGLTPGLDLLRLARDAGIQEITYYGFTTDNCGRPPEQVKAFSEACVKAIDLISQEPVSLLVVGNRDAPTFPPALLPYMIRTDQNGGGIRVNFLVNYGWEWDLAQLERPGSNRKKIWSETRYLRVSRVDLVIRWGGMRRLSGFLPVQSVYADFFVVERLWPDFQPEIFSRPSNGIKSRMSRWEDRFLRIQRRGAAAAQKKPLEESLPTAFSHFILLFRLVLPHPVWGPAPLSFPCTPLSPGAGRAFSGRGSPGG